MAIIWRLPRPELLFVCVGVWLCLALEPNAAARLPSDRLVFPSEPQPKLEPRLKEIDREMAEVSRLTNVTALMVQQEAKKGITSTRTSTGSTEKPPATTTGKGKGKEIVEPAEEQVNTTTPRNRTYPASETKVITFGSDPESSSQRPWEEAEIPTTIKTKVVLEPRITLETTRICPEGFTLSNIHCRKNA